MRPAPKIYPPLASSIQLFMVVVDMGNGNMHASFQAIEFHSSRSGAISFSWHLPRPGGGDGTTSLSSFSSSTCRFWHRQLRLANENLARIGSWMNSAGQAQAGPEVDLYPDGIEPYFAVNHLVPFPFNKLLPPRLMEITRWKQLCGRNSECERFLELDGKCWHNPSNVSNSTERRRRNSQPKCGL
jgi:hypothetical protein